MLMKITILTDDEVVIHEVESSIMNGIFMCDYETPIHDKGMTLFGYEFAAKFSIDPDSDSIVPGNADEADVWDNDPELNETVE